MAASPDIAAISRFCAAMFSAFAFCVKSAWFVQMSSRAFVVTMNLRVSNLNTSGIMDEVIWMRLAAVWAVSALKGAPLSIAATGPNE